MGAITNICFRDIAERETAERKRLDSRLDQLKAIKKTRKILSDDERVEMERLAAIKKILDDETNEVCEPLVVGIRDLFNESPGILGAWLKNHDEGVLQGIALGQQRGTSATGGLPATAVVHAALTIGLSIVDGTRSPPVVVVAVAEPSPEKTSSEKATSDKIASEKGSADKAVAEKATLERTSAALTSSNGVGPSYRIVSTSDAVARDELSRGFYAAIGKAKSMHTLAMLVLPILAHEGDPRGGRDKFPGSVDAAEFARVMLDLVDHGITATEPQLSRRVNEALNRIQSVGENGAKTDLGFDLLAFEDDADVNPVHVRDVGTFITVAMLEELKAFQVVDKLVEFFQQGTLATRSGEAGKQLYRYWKETPNRMSPTERKGLLGVVLGIPGGETKVVNPDFNDLWIRLVSSASTFVRQNEVDKMLRSAVPSAISGQQLRKAARDLIINLSLHGYGMAHFAALDLQEQIHTMLKLLSDPEICAAYGARDKNPWGVIDQVATLELGGARNSLRYRTLATCGVIITAWLANNVNRIMRPTGPIIDMDDVRSPVPRSSGQSATKNPTDYDFINACELWLADTATSEARIEELSQSREAPVMTSRPVAIPSIARDMLEGAGVGLGMGLGYQASRSNGH
jgi:hypothetical protein